MNSVESQMENGLLIVHQTKPKQNYCHWLGICSFALLAATTIFFALLHFEIIPSSANKDKFQMPEILRIKTYLDSLPQESRVQARHANKLAAHLIGELTEQNEIHWDGTVLGSLMEDGMKVEENALVIPRDGLYFVYTQVVFTGSSCLNTDAIQFTHTVSRNNESIGGKMAILTSTKTACERPSKSTWFQPMYQGGVFHLEQGDTLSTETTNTKYLEDNDGKIYFGILAF
ncbi:tumor necrosis factor-like [Pelodytes ibericus]